MATYPPYGMRTSGILGAAMQPRIRRKIFVSYHHGGDQWYYNEFSRLFHDEWETVYDNSLERQVDSDNTDYVMQRIRDNHISGTSCTVVLIGGQTHQRKYVDWEIKATLDKGHGLLGVMLPNHLRTREGNIIVPDRFHANVLSGYASFIHWSDLNSQLLARAVDAATKKQQGLIDNSLPMKARNG
ncbi:TIR domain-containing protein [Curvibacter delicatus]|uniref:TIR domain-containing protein n=1 Tax=Curvibacter delicatus TaxID=80879 RepID=UPI00082B63A5|nr:TIR domain-containing protein [Curvibacter delicatus]